MAGLGQSDGFHRPEAQGVAAALGQDLDGQAPLEPRRPPFPVAKGCRLCPTHPVDKGIVLLKGQRTVDVGCGISRRSGLVVAGLEPRDVEVDAVAVDHRSDGIEEGEGFPASRPQDIGGKAGRRERTCGDNHQAVIRAWQGRHLLAAHLDRRLGGDGRFHVAGKSVAIDSQGTSGRHLVAIGSRHDDGIGASQFLVEQAHGIRGGIIRSERVGTYQFGKGVGPVSIAGAERTHLVEHGLPAPARDLPGGLAPRQATANDMNRFGHGAASCG